MKKHIFALLIMLFATGGLFAQTMGFDSGGVQRRMPNVNVGKMSSSEKMKLIRQIRENTMIEDLKIEDNKKGAFSKIYSEYQDAQAAIKNQFKSDFNPETLSDEEARQKLHESFLIGEKLMENRRKYAEKLQSVLSPQQVLKLYQNEGMIRGKLMDKRAENNNKGGNGFRAESVPPTRERLEP